MTKVKKLALFGHGLCGSKFFAELDNETAPEYEGNCPNPSCNRHVVLAPKELFHSRDKARRVYIRKARSGLDFIFWQA
jgi:hypothetical protein